MTLRVALIGARRVRQGLAPFVARHLVALGAEVPCFLGTSAASVAERERALGARGYTDLGTLLAAERPDALAILSPSETHERYLEAALAAGVHVFCDKPLLWNGPGLARRAEQLVAIYAAAGLWLRENCQWPYTLPAFSRAPSGRRPARELRDAPLAGLARAAADARRHALARVQPAPGPHEQASNSSAQSSSST